MFIFNEFYPNFKLSCPMNHMCISVNVFALCKSNHTHTLYMKRFFGDSECFINRKYYHHARESLGTPKIIKQKITIVPCTKRSFWIRRWPYYSKKQSSTKNKKNTRNRN